MALFPSLRGMFGRSAEAKSWQPVQEWASTYPPPLPPRDPTRGSWPINRAVAEGYERSVWAFKAIETIAGQQSRLPIRVRHRGTQEVVDDHPIQRVLDVKGIANPLETGRQFRKRLSAQLLLSDRGVFCEVTPTNGGDVARVELLPPSRTRPIPGGDDIIQHFEVARPNGPPRQVPVERVRWIREPHPLDPFKASTPMAAAGMSVQMDHLGRAINVTWMSNDGLTRAIVAVKGDLSDGTAEKIERRFGHGPSDAGKITVVGADGLAYSDLAARPRDMQYQQTAKNAKNEVLVAFGTPESQLGNASDRTFANADAEAVMFWTITMPPHLELIAAAFDIDVDDDLELFYDTSGVEALEIAQRSRREEARAEVSAGLRSIVSYAEMAGIEVVRTPETAALWVPTGARPIEQGEPLAPAAPQPAGEPAGPSAASQTTEPEPDASNSVATPPAAAGGGSQPGAVVSAEPADTSGAKLRALPGGRLTVVHKAAVSPRVRHSTPDERAVARAEDAAAAALTALATRWIRRTQARLRSPKTRKGTRHWQPDPSMPTDSRAGTKALDAPGVVDAAAWEQEARDAIEPILTAAAHGAANAAATDLTGQPPRDEQQDSATQDEGGAGAGALAVIAAGVLAAAATAGISAVVAGVGVAAAHRAARLARAIGRADRDGATLQEVMGLVSGTDLTAWATALGRTAAGAAVAAGRDTAATLTADAGLRVVGTWHAHRDERTRPSHRLADGQQRQAGQRWVVGEALLRYPRDPLGPPEEIANCRCWLTWSARRITTTPPVPGRTA